MTPKKLTREEMVADQKAELLRELDFRMAVTTAILSTLDLDQTLYVILSGITSGDGLGFNRAILFLADDRALEVKLAVGPTSGEVAEQIWRDIEAQRLDFAALLPRFEAFQRDSTSQALTKSLQSFSLPLHRLKALATSSQSLIVETSATLGSVLATCLTSRVPFCSNALTVRQETGGAGGEILQLSHIAVVPLTVEQRLIGAIVADNSYSGARVSSTKLRSLHAIGNLAALAIDRARLHAQTVAMAEIDGLTGTYNRRFYEREVQDALDSARSSGMPLSIIVFDLDHFKRCNDTHGHLVGDEVLKNIARLLQSQVRQTDIVARYGGEEFIVLLKNTDARSAKQVAEKLREMVQNARFEQSVVLTVSAGVASTLGTESAAQLFERADEALYQAKQAGRNRVCLSKMEEAGP